MMENLRSEEESIIKDIRNLFKLRKELNYTAIKNVRNLFRQEKEIKAIKDKSVIFGVTIILNTKVTVIEVKHYQFRNILIKLDHI